MYSTSSPPIILPCTMADPSLHTSTAAACAVLHLSCITLLALDTSGTSPTYSCPVTKLQMDPSFNHPSTVLPSGGAPSARLPEA